MFLSGTCVSRTWVAGGSSGGSSSFCLNVMLAHDAATKLAQFHERMRNTKHRGQSRDSTGWRPPQHAQVTGDTETQTQHWRRPCRSAPRMRSTISHRASGRRPAAQPAQGLALFWPRHGPRGWKASFLAPWLDLGIEHEATVRANTSLSSSYVSEEQQIDRQECHMLRIVEERAQTLGYTVAHP